MGKTREEQIKILKGQIMFYKFYTSFTPVVNISINRCQILLDKLEKDVLQQTT